MVVHTLTYLHDTFNVHLKKVDIQFPTSSSAIIQLVEQAILQIANGTAEKSHRIRVAVFSHITSVPAIILPVEKLIELCHKHNILVLLDGAHAPGIPFSLPSFPPSFLSFLEFLLSVR
jgi:selenocysteine lyase/cysteine desulfurase